MDNLAYRFPVSVKGVLLNTDSKVVLLRNERNEWELPGGKLEIGEEPGECVKREIREELFLDVRVGPAIDAWVYSVTQEVRVLIVTYGCFSLPFEDVRCSHEHKEAGLFRPEEIASLHMPEGYKKSIAAWLAVVSSAGA